MSTPQTPQPQPPPDGKYLGWLSAVKGLTVTNALVIIMLAIVIIPGYVLYRAVNDAQLLDRFLSDYREYASQQMPCVLREAKVRGGSPVWSISTGFAFSGADRWSVSVTFQRKPGDEELASYCATLGLIVDFMRDPEAQSPPFPGTDEPIVRQYRRDNGP